MGTFVLRRLVSEKAFAERFFSGRVPSGGLFLRRLPRGKLLLRQLLLARGSLFNTEARAWTAGGQSLASMALAEPLQKSRPG